MKPSLLCFIIFAGLYILLSPLTTLAQSAYGVSGIRYDSRARRVYGYSSTYLDYRAALYYDPATGGELYRQDNNETPLARGYTEGISNAVPAEVWTGTALYRPVTKYTTNTNHFLRAYYYYSVCSGFLSGCYADPYGYSFLPGGRGGNYPGGRFTPTLLVGSRRYFLGATEVSITTPRDEDCSVPGTPFDSGGVPCPQPTPTPVPIPEGMSFDFDISPQSVRPSETGGTDPTKKSANGEDKVTITVRTTPPTSKLNVTFSSDLEVGDDGGHKNHIGSRPTGTIKKTDAVTDAAGILRAEYTAPIFGGSVRIKVKIGGVERFRDLAIAVPGLAELSSGDNYELTGFTNPLPRRFHPQGTNHWGTPEANRALVLIADDYKAEYYADKLIPEKDRLKYNDQSLPRGGKFEVNGTWRPGVSHHEHRIGLNCDVGSNNVPHVRGDDRWGRLKDIFTFRGSTLTEDETATSEPHWHMRFYFGKNLPLRYVSNAENFVPGVLWAALDRAPGDDEQAYWINRLTAAKAHGPVRVLNDAKAFARSQLYSAEYATRTRGDEDFVSDLYSTYLQREPDETGYTTWLGTLRADNARGEGGREHLVRAFEESTEFANLVAGDIAANPIDDSRTFVRQQYVDFLGREPDGSGWEFWTRQITGCETDLGCIERKRTDVARAFIADQYPAATSDNAAFVRQCYLSMLRREPNGPPENSNDGYNGWLGVLNSYGSPAAAAGHNHVLRAFLAAPEYRRRFGEP